MERKTKVSAEEGKQEMVITREFDLPVDLLFKAYTEPGLIEQWMSNHYSNIKLIEYEGKKHGSYQTETTDAQGNVVFSTHGTIHEFSPNKKITRTFEMENMPTGVQLEIYEFEPLSETTSRLNMHVLYESVEQRDRVLKMPFASGISMAHDRIQEIMKTLK